MRIFTPSCLPSRESGKLGRTPPHVFCCHSLLSPGRTNTLSHSPPQPPPAQGFLTSQSEKWVLSGPWGVRVFITFSKASMRKQQQQRKEGWLTGQPRHPFLTATPWPLPFPSARDTHPPAASLWAAEWLFTQKLLCVCSHPSPLS